MYISKLSLPKGAANVFFDLRSLQRWTAPAFFFWIAALMFVAPNATGQPDWLKEAISKSEGYQVDKDASALILHKVARVDVSSGGHSSRRVQVAVKVLSQAGVLDTYFGESVGENRHVKDLKGWRVDGNGKCHNLDKKSVVEVDIEDAAGYYNDLRQMVAVFPEVHTGDVVAYEYKVEEKSGWESYYQSFSFHSNLPVVYTSFSVTIPPGWEYCVSGHNLDSVVRTAEGSTYSWTYTDLPYRPEEPLMPPWDYVTRKISVNCYDPQNSKIGHFPDWRSICQWGADLYEEPSHPNPALSNQVAEITGESTDSWEKFCAVARYVRDNVRYVGVEIGEGRLQPRPCDVTWANKYGDCKDKVTLMRAMLSAVDIPSRAVLANLGSWVDPKLPSPFQFNHVILSIPSDAVSCPATELPAVTDGWLYFDPTDESMPPGWLPAWLHDERVLGLSAEDSSLVRLKSLNTRTYKRAYRAKARLLEDNSVSADICVVDYGSRAHSVRHERSTTSADDIVREWREALSESMRTPAISEVQMGYDGDSAWITFHVEAENYLNHTGDFGLLKADFFNPDRPNELSTKERVHPVWFGRYGAFETDITWTLPEGTIVSETPPDDSVSCESANLQFAVTTGENNLHVKAEVEYKGTIEDVEDYLQARNFYRSRRAAFEARILLTNN